MKTYQTMVYKEVPTPATSQPDYKAAIIVPAPIKTAAALKEPITPPTPESATLEPTTLSTPESATLEPTTLSTPESATLEPTTSPSPASTSASATTPDTDLPQLTSEYIYAQTFNSRKLSDAKLVGNGSQATIQSAIYKGKHLVASKAFAETEDFLTEMAPMACFRSAYTEPVLGIDRKHNTLLMPLRKCSLKDLLCDKQQPFAFSWPILLNVALGLSDIHASGYAHRDIKPGNILIDHQGFARLADYGTSWRLSNPNLTLMAGTPIYMAPELLEGNKAIELTKTDIYSMGMLMLEMAIGYESFDNIFPNNPYSIFYEVAKGTTYNKAMDEVNRLKQKPSMKVVCELITACIDKDPSKRPSIKYIIEAIMKEAPQALTHAAVRPIAPPPQEELFYWVDATLQSCLNNYDLRHLTEKQVTDLVYLYAITSNEQVRTAFVNWLTHTGYQNDPLFKKMINLLKKTTTKTNDLAVLARLSPGTALPCTLSDDPANTDVTAFSDTALIVNACKAFQENSYASSTFFYRGYIKRKVERAIACDDKAKQIPSIIDEYAFGLGM